MIKMEEEQKTQEPKEEQAAQIFALRTTANREDQVMDFLSSNVKKKNVIIS